jgi:hypothetical protein
MKLLLIFVLCTSAFGASLYNDFSKELNQSQLKKIRNKAIGNGAKSIPDLVKVINNKKYPIKSKWQSIFLIGQIMGNKSIPYLESLSKNKNWMIRLAALKSIGKLNHKSSRIYSDMLKDKAMIIRFEALDTISRLKLSHLSKNVWNMLYDNRNYSKTDKGRKRSDLIKKVIKVVGDLKFEEAKKPLLKMAKNIKYNDIFSEIDYSLTRITNKESKGNSIEAKRFYWKVQSI